MITMTLEHYKKILEFCSKHRTIGEISEEVGLRDNLLWVHLKRLAENEIIAIGRMQSKAGGTKNIYQTIDANPDQGLLESILSTWVTRINNNRKAKKAKLPPIDGGGLKHSGHNITNPRVVVREAGRTIVRGLDGYHTTKADRKHTRATIQSTAERI